MRRYLYYLHYLLKHKYYVMLECFKLGLYKRGLIHDISKLYPSEFIPYARFFYNSNGTPKAKRQSTGYYKPTDTGDIDFDTAWFLHQKRNAHHWQYYILPEDTEGYKILPIPEIYMKEMVCDWKGAGKAQGTPGVTVWYNRNKEKLQFHPESRKYIEKILDI